MKSKIDSNIKMKRPLRSVFLKAAEFQHAANYSRFSCDNLTYAINHAVIYDHFVHYDDCEMHLKMYHKMFKPRGHVEKFVGWWDTFSDKDNEARIYALLLCAEMLRR